MKRKIIRLRKRLQKPGDVGSTVFGALKTPGSDMRDREAALVQGWLDADEKAYRKAVK